MKVIHKCIGCFVGFSYKILINWNVVKNLIIYIVRKRVVRLTKSYRIVSTNAIVQNYSV